MAFFNYVVGKIRLLKKKPFYSFNRKKNRTIYFSVHELCYLYCKRNEDKTAEISTLVIFVFSNFEPFGGV